MQAASACGCVGAAEGANSVAQSQDAEVLTHTHQHKAKTKQKGASSTLLRACLHAATECIMG
jgi:hypothetical protein